MADNIKKAYGTDPAQAEEILRRFLKIHDKMKSNIEANPSMKAGEKKKRLADLARKHKYFHEGVKAAKHIDEISKLPVGHPELPPVFLSDGNSKLSKDGIISWNLPAGHSCPGKGDCFGFCYAMGGPQSWPAAMKKRYDNWAVAERDDFVPRANAELKRWGTSGKKKMGDLVRVHDSGDFYSQDYINKWSQIAKSNPDKHFYAYTKAHHLDFNPLTSLPNFKIIQSVGGNQDEKIDINKPHAFIFPSNEALHASGYANASESDLPAADPKNTKVGLVIHGVYSGQYKPDSYATNLKKSKGRYHLVGKEIPDVHRFDQIDAPDQLEYSRHPTDRLKALRIKMHEGNYSSDMDTKIADIKKAFADVKPLTLEEKIQKIKEKYHSMKLAKGDVIQFPKKFRPLNDDFLNDKKPLTVGELQNIEDHIDHSQMMIDLSGPNDEDVRIWHAGYLDKLGNRVQSSIDAKQGKAEVKPEASKQMSREQFDEMARQFQAAREKEGISTEGYEQVQQPMSEKYRKIREALDRQIDKPLKKSSVFGPFQLDQLIWKKYSPEEMERHARKWERKGEQNKAKGGTDILYSTWAKKIRDHVKMMRSSPEEMENQAKQFESKAAEYAAQDSPHMAKFHSSEAKRVRDHIASLSTAKEPDLKKADSDKPKEAGQYHVHLGLNPAKEAAGKFAQWHMTKDQLGDVLKNWDKVQWEKRSGSRPSAESKFHSTAITRNKLSTPIESYLKDNNPKGKILYHGVGRDDVGAKALKADRYDPYHPDAAVRKEPKSKYDEVHSHYTLNVVDKDTGHKILSHIHSLLNDKGKAVVSVRRDLPKADLKKSIVRPSLKDTFPMTFMALEMDKASPEVMLHHKQMHEAAALKATNPVSAMHHRDNAQKIHEHLSKGDELQKQDGMDAAAASIKNAFGGSAPATPPPPPPPPPAAPATEPMGSLSSNITAGVNKLLGKGETSLVQKFKDLKKNMMMGYGAQSQPQLPAPQGLAMSSDKEEELAKAKVDMPPPVPKPPEPKVKEPKIPKPKTTLVIAGPKGVKTTTI